MRTQPWKRYRGRTPGQQSVVAKRDAERSALIGPVGGEGGFGTGVLKTACFSRFLTSERWGRNRRGWIESENWLEQAGSFSMAWNGGEGGIRTTAGC